MAKPIWNTATHGPCPRPAAYTVVDEPPAVANPDTASPSGDTTTWDKISGKPTTFKPKVDDPDLLVTFARKDGSSYTGTHDFTGATVTGISGGGGPTADTTTWLPASNGTDDTSAINAILAASGGKFVRGRPGTTYLITNPLVLPAGGNVVLDMTACTVRLKAGSAVKNLLNNQSVTAQRTVADAAITTGTTTLTSATAAFTSADVGRWVKIAGAAVGGDLLVARIAVVTNGTTVTLDTAASSTVSGAALNIHDCDRDIVVRGGVWDHGSAAATNTANDHAIRFRFAERLLVRDMFHTNTAGKYAISVAAAVDYIIENHEFISTFSDGVHITGPATRGIIRNLQGTTGDDLVSVTPQEPAAWDHYNDVLGTVADLVIENIHKKGGNARVLHLVAGRSGWLKNVRARNIAGTSATRPVYLWGDSVRPGSRMDNVVIENVTAKAATDDDMVVVYQVTGDNLTFRNIYRDNTNTARYAVNLLDSTLGVVNIDGLVSKLSGSAGSPLLLNGTTSVDTLTVSRLDLSVTTATTVRAIQVWNTSSVKQFIVRDSVFNFAGGANCWAFYTESSGTIERLVLSGVRIKNTAQTGGVVLTANNTANLSTLSMSDTYSDGPYWAVGDLIGTTAVQLSNCRAKGNSGIVAVKATAVVTLDGSLEADFTNIAVTAGGTVRSKSLGIRGDVGQINNKQTGDLMTNTNASRSCGVGPVSYNGTAWVHLGSGATF